MAESTEDSVIVDLPWPEGIDTYVFDLRGQTARAMYRRLIEVSVE